jgi:four helix bundle protein
MENGNLKIENNTNRKTIKSFQDLEVYQRLYKAMIIVLKDIVTKLPDEEKYDLKDQIRRCCKASPALLAEGFAKRYQQKSWKKYLEDAIGESNEMIHHLSVCRDVYSKNINVDLCGDLINTYDIANRQLYTLHESWKDFHSKY